MLILRYYITYNQYSFCLVLSENSYYEEEEADNQTNKRQTHKSENHKRDAVCPRTLSSTVG